MTCDPPAGRSGSGEVSEPEREDVVPRLDMKTLTEDSWGGEAGGCILLVLHDLHIIQLTSGRFVLHSK